MPGASARFEPFFTLLPSLSADREGGGGPPRHLPRPQPKCGVAPVPSRCRVAGNAVAPARRADRASAARADSAAPRRHAPPPRRPVAERRRAVGPHSAAVSPPRPTATDGRAVAQPPVASPPRQPRVAGQPAPVDRPAPLEPRAGDRPADDRAAGDRLSGIDKLLARRSRPSRRRRPSRRSRGRRQPAARSGRRTKAAEAQEAAAAKKAAEEEAAEAKKAGRQEGREEKKQREALGVAGTNWVQLAGGSNQDRMATEYKKLAAKARRCSSRGRLCHRGQGLFPPAGRPVRQQERRRRRSSTSLPRKASTALAGPALRRPDQDRETLPQMTLAPGPCRAPVTIARPGLRGRRSRPARPARRLPARPRPHRPFGRLPPPAPQDAGVRRARRRPFPGSPDPFDRGRADRPDDGADRSGSTRI